MLFSVVLNGFIRLIGFIIGTNLYRLEVPGRFEIYWAALATEITCHGKLRKYDKELHHVDFANYFFQHSQTDVNKFNEMLWPEAWNINITVKNLSINNFNTYIDYFSYGGYALNSKNEDELAHKSRDLSTKNNKDSK